LLGDNSIKLSDDEENLKKTISAFTLILLTALIWEQLYSAQFLEYDENFGQLIEIFLVSTALLVNGIVMIVKNSELVRTNLIVSILFLLINSPLTIFLVVSNYDTIFGTGLKVG
jgi:hypothetical protein